MANTSPHHLPDHSPHGPERNLPRLVLMIAAVVLAAIGLLSLAAVLVTAFLQGTVWPGFVAGAYVCLPVAFVLMMLMVISGIRARKRA
ncbi:hypothetical protein [Arthrobacter sp. H20]|uniref:hypothetical protein n=1 Tax=Arthrobacter sp. H20 TaxID=1267981 RepID=UPI00047DC4B3|nr:hypothetical protein [Arthrobacter sp. H20]